MTNPIPPGHEGMIPHLVCTPCADAIEFYKNAFGAEEICRMLSPNDPRIMHAEMKLDGKTFYLADDFPEYCGGQSRSAVTLGGTPVTIHQYVANCDQAIDRAAKAGATVTMPATDMFWGDRYGQVVDPFGHLWAFATHQRDMTDEEMQKAAEAMFAQSAPGA